MAVKGVVFDVTSGKGQLTYIHAVVEAFELVLNKYKYK